MLVVLAFVLTAMIYMNYKSNQGTDEPTGDANGENQDIATENVSEVEAIADAEPLIVESRTTYEYAETGNTYTLVDEGGPGPWEFTCTGIATIKTSSVLTPQGKASYLADNMTDLNESTAWAEGTGGFGVGEWIEFTLTDEYKKWGYTNSDFIANSILGDFHIQTGYAKSPATWKNNGRPVKLKSYLNGQALSIIQLSDSPHAQVFSIFPEQTEPSERVVLKEGDVIRFEILDVAPGLKDEDACISEFHIGGSCG